MILTYTPEIQARMARLDKVAPPPRDTLTLEEIAEIFDMAEGSLNNMKSQGRLPFPVLKIGGSVRVDKLTFAKYQAGIKVDNFEPTGGMSAKPKNKGGRPKNSAGLQRHATNKFLAAYYQIVEKHKTDITSPIAGKTFPPYKKKRMGE